MRTHAAKHFLCLLLLFTPVILKAATPDTISTPRGDPIQVLAEHPEGDGPFPTVILGSGSNYAMNLPILEHVAHELVKNGFAVFRFNWAYYVKDPVNGKQSKDRAAEIEDFTTVLNLARQKPWVDKDHILVGGKSLGSIIAWRVLRTTPDVKGALLLTPVCSAGKPPIKPEDNYPEINTETRPTAWILGDQDNVCSNTTLYGFLAQSAGSARIDVLSGNHSFETTKPASAANALEQRLDSVAKVATDFALSTFGSNQIKSISSPSKAP